MSFKSMFEQAKKDKKVKGLSAEYVEFKKDGDGVLGRLLARNKVESGIGNVPYFQYLFETDKGNVKCALGTATDGEAGALMGIGGVYSITFKGKQDIGKGRQLNKFEILEIVAPPEGVVGGADDVPF